MNLGDSAAVGGLPPGTRLGQYRIVQRIALGGMAELYLARKQADAGFTKLVALKRVLPHLAEDAEFVEMFLNEAKLAAGLEHPNIASVTDFGQAGREFFMVLEFVHGRGVNELLRVTARTGGVPLPCALSIVIAVAAALHHAHEATDAQGAPLGLVHRDVSPSNILVSYDGAIKLVDFGIAKATSQAEATRSRAIKGKLAYMSPEQARGGAIDRTADVFSLGAVLYELTTGRRCFFAEGEFALLNKVADGKYLPPTKVSDGYPARLEAIVARALSVDPAHRFPTARAMQAALEDFAAESGLRLSAVALSEFVTQTFGDTPYPTTSVLPLTEPHPPASTSRSTSTRSKRAGWVGGAALGITVGIALGAAAMWREPEAPTTAEPTAAPPPLPAGTPEPSPEADAQAPPATTGGIEVLEEDGPAELEVAPKPPSRRTKRGGGKRTGKRRRKPSSRPKAATVPSEFLPPSHRD